MPTQEELSPSEQPQSVFRQTLPLDAKLERARTELLDLSARNRLLNIPRSAKSATTLEIVDEKSSEIYRLLVSEGKAFTFLPGREAKKDLLETPEVGPPHEEVAELAQPEDTSVDTRGVLSRHSDTRLQTRMTSQGLQKRLLDLYTDAITLEQEQGVNILYLALGTLKWLDPKDNALTRYAPLLLVPVTLERGTAAERFKLRVRPEDISSNLSLEAYLDRIHKIRLPEFEATDEFDPILYMQSVASAISSKEGWQVNEDDIVLGFFSFAKFLMYRDLDPECWPETSKLSSQPLVRALLMEGFIQQDELVPEDANLDALLRPQDMIHIVDCDSSQALAVQEARSGKSLVIQGPPGTGKSQTIANVIASAVADGKTVLFVAEKMAALDVVKRRLDAAGVGDACLELHSNKANKRQLLQELNRTWDLARPRSQQEDNLCATLLSVRDDLNGFVTHLHLPHERAGLTPFQVIGELSRLQSEGVPPASHPLANAASWTAEERREREAVLADLRERIALIGHPAEHPWRGVDLPPLLPTDIVRLTSRIEPVLGELRTYLSQIASFAATLQSEEPPTFDGIRSMEALAKRVAASPALSTTALRSEIWNEPKTVEALLEHGATYANLKTELSGKVNFDRLPSLNLLELSASTQTLSLLPGSVTADQLRIAGELLTTLPQLQEYAASLSHAIGRTEPLENLRAVDVLIQIAQQIAKAPTLPAGAFASPRWETEVEHAYDVAESLAILERAKAVVGNQLSDAAWETDLNEARQALAEYGGSLFRFFSGRWRQMNRFANSFFANPKAPLAHKLILLDELQRGRKATAEIEREKEFGSDIFGPEWRGARSASAHLLALTEWVRGLAHFSLLSDRAMIRMLAPTQLHNDSLHGLIANTQLAVQAAQKSLFSISQFIPSDKSFSELAAYLKPVASADMLFQQVAHEQPAQLAERVHLLQRIGDLLQLEGNLRESRAIGDSAFGDIWQDELSDWPRLREISLWIAANQDIRWIAGGVEDKSSLMTAVSTAQQAREELSRDIAGLLQLLHWTLSTGEGGVNPGALCLRVFEARLHVMLDRHEHLSHWTNYQDRSKQAAELGLAAFVDGLEAEQIPSEALLQYFHSAYYEGLLQNQLAGFPELARFDGSLHERSIANFCALDRQHIRQAAFDVARAHYKHIPATGGIGPVAVLRGEIARRRGHMPIRQVMLKAAPVVQALKPVMMMSPLSVAQFLSPGHMTFDLLVMDEASQIQPVDALGAIARCKQMIVVGDERQLPPTKFFAKMTSSSVDSDEDEDMDGAQVGDLESVLGLCLSKGLPQRMLRWHYRSRHQSLIAVSNSQFYENKLKIIPSPYTQEAGTGLRFIHVPNGIFESGAKAANSIEAKVVAEAVIRHALDHPEQSLGVATFSVRQRKAILDHLEGMRRVNPLAEAFFTAHPSEPFFIKNLENVQGDERDVIFISVGYGRNENGFFAMRFGPLGTDGGERRLNVLISRAKRRCDVFASITDDDIDLERARGRGVVTFKLFLHYARTGHLQMGGIAVEGASRSALAQQIAQAVQANGYQAHLNVGLSGLFIDIAVSDAHFPGRYILGVELDGPSYASAQSARDRDRLRNTALRDHGWYLHHIWSMDWLHRPTEQMQQLLQTIKEAQTDLANAQRLRQDLVLPIEIVTIEREVDAIISAQMVESSNAKPYEEAVLRDLPIHQDLASTSPLLLAKFVKDVVTVEGPVHREEVIARIRSAWNLSRSGTRIQAAIGAAIELAIQNGEVAGEDFLQLPNQPVVPRDRSIVNSAGLRGVEMLPSIEIDVAILEVVEASMGGTHEEVVQAVSRLLGFKATSTNLRDAIIRQVASLLEQDQLLAKDGFLLKFHP